MTEIYDCPADGCDYTGPHSSVAAHYSGKRDDAHSGGYQRGLQLLEETKPRNTVGETKSDEQPDQESPDLDRDEDTVADSNPLFGGPDPKPTEQSKDAPGCPDCGGTDYFDASESGYPHGCPDCSDAENWVVWE